MGIMPTHISKASYLRSELVTIFDYADRLPRSSDSLAVIVQDTETSGK